MSKDFMTTTLNLNELGDIALDVVKEIQLDEMTILTSQKIDWMTYMARVCSETGAKLANLSDETKNDKPDFEPEFEKMHDSHTHLIGKMVGNVSHTAYNTGYVEGRRDGEADVISAIRAAMETGRIEQDPALENLLDFLSGVSKGQFNKHTEGKPLTVMWNKDDKDLTKD